MSSLGSRELCKAFEWLSGGEVKAAGGCAWATGYQSGVGAVWALCTALQDRRAVWAGGRDTFMNCTCR